MKRQLTMMAFQGAVGVLCFFALMVRLSFTEFSVVCNFVVALIIAGIGMSSAKQHAETAAWANGVRGNVGFFSLAPHLTRAGLVLIAAAGTGLLSVAAWRLFQPAFLRGVVDFIGPRWMALAIESAGVVIGNYFFGAVLIDGTPRNTFLRGRSILTRREAERRANAARRKDDRGMPLGGVLLPSEAGPLHTAIVGATGSGKTLTFRLLMQHMLADIGAGRDQRAVMYDAKLDLLSLVHGMGFRCRIRTFHPLDARGIAWDMARDCVSPAAAMQIASGMIPVEEGPNRFFSDAARDLLYGVLLSFMKLAPDRWTFRDVVLAMGSSERLRRVLGRRPETAHYLQYFAEERTFANIMSSVKVMMSAYAPIAGAWWHAKEKISLAEWIKEESILVLGNDESVRYALDSLNRVIFQRLSELLLSQPESNTRRAWMFLDEVREAGKLEALPRFLLRGRSKGVCMVLGFQDIEGMRAVYGEKVANELVGQCANKAIFRLESPETAAWAAAVVGDYEAMEINQGGMPSQNAMGGTFSEQTAKRGTMLPSEFMQLPPTNPANGLTGIYLSPFVGVWKSTLSGAELASGLLPSHPKFPNFVPRPIEQQYLKDWDESDLRRLGLK